MTTKLFHADSYQKIFSATVSSINTDLHAVTLDQTAFFPGGGGQPADQGSLEYNDLSVQLLKIKQITGVIFHFFPEDQPLPEPGIPVSGFLDWDHRYQLMRTHTAMHILC